MKLIFSILLVLSAAAYNSIFTQTNLTVVVNELMSDNEASVADEAGDFDDWIELYNNLDVPMDLTGYGLSDDVDDLGKFTLPDNTTIPANGYLIIWADDDQEQGPLHAQFRLSASGESVILTDPNGAIVDQVDFPELGEDQAYARDPNGTGPFRVKEQSLGGNNDLATSTFSPLPASISYSPNPTKDFLHILALDKNGETKVQLYNMNGALILEQSSLDNNINIDLRALPAGNLILKIDDYQAVVIQKVD